MLNDYIEKIKDNLKEGLEGDDSLSEAEELELYKIAGDELESDARDAGVWAKAMAKGKGNPEGAYIEYRFQALKAQFIRERAYLRKQYQKEHVELAKIKKIEKIERDAQLEVQREAEEVADKKQRRKKAWREFMRDISIFVLVIGSIVTLISILSNP